MRFSLRAGRDMSTRRDFLRMAGAGALAAAAPGLLWAQQTQATRPNVLFIAVDDLNDWANCLGGYGGSVHTPNLDRLAARGVLFTNAHCAAPSCNPSRTAVMTGIRPDVSGVYNNNQNWHESPVLQDAETIPRHFRAAGYRAVGGGKIFHALSWIQTSYGLDLNDFGAWDEYFPSKQRSMPETSWPAGATEDAQHTWRWDPVARGYVGRRPPYYFDWGAIPVPDDQVGDFKVVDWAIGELQRPHPEPFFQAVGIFKPHIPWFVPQKYFDLYPLEEIVTPDVRLDWEVNTPPEGLGLVRRDWHKWVLQNDQWRRAIQGYLASISFADAQLGRLLDALDASPHRGNTIVVLWSDHGFHLGERDHWEKFTLWERSTRVTFMVTAPGVTTPGGRCAEPVNLLDIYPTLNELCGLPGMSRLSGRSLVPQLRDPTTSRPRPIVTTWGESHAVRDTRWRYILYGDGGEELYDHDNDPGEWRNLARDPEHTETKAELLDWLLRIVPERRDPVGRG